jgi:Sulfotransferase family
MTAFIKQYGEKRTGTNVLRALLYSHFRDVTVLMHVLGDKHSPPSPDARGCRPGTLGFVVSVKHPYAWLASVRRFALLDPQSPAPDTRAACERFNANYRSWLALRAEHGERVVVVRYERLLAHPSACLARIARSLGLERQTAGAIDLPANVVVPTRCDHMPTRTAPVPFDRDYYVRRDYLADLSDADKDTMRARIDWAQLAPYGYAPE